MEANEKGRFFKYLARHSPWSILLRLESIIFLCNLLLSSAFFYSCTEEADEVKVDSTIQTFSSIISVRGGGRTDLFIYDLDNFGSLEKHYHFTSRKDTSLSFRSRGDKEAVAISDFPYTFNVRAVEKLESLELLELDIDSDNPDKPVRSCICEFTAGQDCTLKPDPLLCRIQLAKVHNTCGKEFLLENPCIYLTGANRTVELLRYTGFRQTSPTSDTLRTALPHDIGIPPLYSEQALYCYPNDDPQPGIGNPETVLVLECRVKGERKEFSAPLPPMGRGTEIKVSFEIRSATEYSYSIY